MNRRQLLKGLAALPFIGVAAARVIPRDGVALMATPHPIGPSADAFDLNEENMGTVYIRDSRNLDLALRRMQNELEGCVYSAPTTDVGLTQLVRSA